MSRVFVGTITADSADALRSIVQSFATADSFYFVRWAHRVELTQQIDEALPSPAGQLFGHQFELRWKQNARQAFELPAGGKATAGYQVLLLHCGTVETEWEFQPIDGNWQVSEPRAAHLYDSDETRFPQGFKKFDKFKVQQRYVRDADTDTVRFVALTLA